MVLYAMCCNGTSEVSKWLLDGFNALTIAYGEDCTGKRSYMLGSSQAHAAYVPDVLSRLYQASDESPLRIALSLWALRGNDIIEYDTTHLTVLTMM